MFEKVREEGLLTYKGGEMEFWVLQKENTETMTNWIVFFFF